MGWRLLVLAFAMACAGDKGGGGDDDDDDGGEVDLTALCEAAQDCDVDGNYYTRVEDCVEAVESLREDALDEGCGLEFRSYVSCLADDPVCDGSSLGVGDCEEEVDDFSECLFGGYGYTGTRDTGYYYYSYTTSTEQPPPTGIDGMSVTCSGGMANVSVGVFVTDGSEVILDVADTVNAPSNYYEAHTVPATAAASNYTEFANSLQAGATYQAGVSSLFSCDPGVHYDEEPKGSVMTYVVRAYDLGGLVDCFGVGDDPAGMIGGSYETYGNVIQPSDISTANCSQGTWSR